LLPSVSGGDVHYQKLICRDVDLDPFVVFLEAFAVEKLIGLRPAIDATAHTLAESVASDISELAPDGVSHLDVMTHAAPPIIDISDGQYDPAFRVDIQQFTVEKGRGQIGHAIYVIVNSKVCVWTLPEENVVEPLGVEVETAEAHGLQGAVE
jgi:hypothetical protein